ncbi:MAG: hypothetical protein Q8L64_02980 [bacterium]|nr:hypothetical protein [bacterium]
MRKVKLFSKPVLYVTAVVYIFAVFLTLAAGDQLAGVLFAEDRYFENMGAFGFFAASFIFFYGFIRTLKRYSVNVFSRIRQFIILGLALLFLFGGGEEISWGQRIFNIQTPEALAGINAQEETNIHNIELFEYKVPFERMFDLFWLSLTVILPLVVMFVSPLRELIGKFFTVPHLGIGLLFLFNYLWAKVAEVIYRTGYTFTQVPFIQAIQEIKESNYALLFVLVAIYTIQDFNEA